MENVNDKLSIDEMANEIIARNNKSLKTIDNVLKFVDESKKKEEAIFQELGITNEIRSENTSLSDLSSGEQKIFDVVYREFLAELHAKGLGNKPEAAKKSQAGLTLSRKRLRI